MEIDLSLIKDDNRWADHPDINQSLCVDITNKLLGCFPQAQNQNIEISILLTDDQRMQELNKQFLNNDYPTNVLSFPDQNLDRHLIQSAGLPSTEIYLGDIALGYDILCKESQQKQIPMENHFIHLIIHGILHLLGFDHDTETKTLEMQEFEIKTLQQYDILSPYSH